MATPEMKNGMDWAALGKQLLIPIILLAVIGVESSLFALNMIDQDQTRKETDSLLQQLQEDNEDLQEQYHSLSEQYENLTDQFTNLTEAYQNLTGGHTNLTADYAELTEDYSDLQDDYNDLYADYTALQQEYYVEQCLHIGNSLASYYNYLRQEIGPTGASNWWTTPDDYWQLAADFAANLGLHNLAEIYWPSIEPYYSDVVGEYSYETAKGIIDEIIDLIGTRATDSDTVKIYKILAFIAKYITYEYDVNDIFSAPVETLGFRSGDCDDFTILAATLLEAVGIDTAVGLFVNDANEYHAMVLTHLEALEGYGYWYFSDLTSLGLTAGRWIIIEGQIPLADQDSDWISQWSLFAVAPLDG
jgi:hypothetical protein